MTDSTQLREQIEQTRSNLSADVNTLAETVKPGNVARRQTDKVRGKFSGAVESVMGKKDSVLGQKDALLGKKEDLMDRASDASASSGSALSGVGDSLSHAPAAIKGTAGGNPVAAGLVAFGVGWLAGSLLPATSREQQAASAVKEKALPVVKDAGSTIADHLRDPATDALQTVKSAAVDAASTVKDEGTSSVQDLKGSALDAKETVQESRS